MKVKIEDVSGLPDALQSLVSEGELDLGQVAPASELEKFKGKALQAQQEAIERRKALEAWKALGDTPDDVRTALEAKGGKASEEHQAIIAKMKADHAEALSQAQARLTETYRRQATAELKAALAESGVVPEGLDLLAGYASSRIEFQDDGTPRVLAKDGAGPMVGSGPNGGATLSDLAKELAKSIPHLVADKGAGGGGKQPGAGGGKPEGKTVTRAEWDQMGHGARAEFSKSGGKVVDA